MAWWSLSNDVGTYVAAALVIEGILFIVGGLWVKENINDIKAMYEKRKFDEIVASTNDTIFVGFGFLILGIIVTLAVTLCAVLSWF